MILCEIRKEGLTIVIIPARSDNYMYLLEWDGGAALVDATDAKIANQVCEHRNRRLSAILSTHHHHDHVGGNLAVQAVHNCPVYGPPQRIPGLTHPLGHDDDFAIGPLFFRVIGTAGHTAGCLSYHLPESCAVFTGDALFAGGCGRLFECDAETMWSSLQRLANLPPETEVYCGHEYTASNLRFALSVDPENLTLQERVKSLAALTIPSTIADELATNPFLRAANAAEFARRRSAKDCF